MTPRIVWTLVDLVAVIASAVLVVIGAAPPSVLVSVLSVIVAVRAGKTGTDDDDDHPRGGGAAPRLGGSPSSSRTLPSATYRVLLGLRRWAQEVARAGTLVDVTAAIALGIAVVMLTSCHASTTHEGTFIMGNLTRTIAVPTTVGSTGASQDCTTMRGDRCLIYKGTTGDLIELYVSNDDTNYIKLPSQDIAGASAIKQIPEKFGYIKAKRVKGTAAASLVLIGAEETHTTGPAGPPALGNSSLSGSASTTDTTVTTLLSFTPGANGTYSVIAHVVGTKDDGSAYSGLWQAVWKRVSGTLSAVGIRAISEETSNLDSGACTATVAGGVAKLNVVGITATNIAWTGQGTLIQTA